MFFYLYVKCPEGAGKGWKAAIRTWIDHFKRDREFRKKYILFFYITMVLFKTLINRDMWMNPLCDVWGVWGIYRYNTVTGQCILTSEVSALSKGGFSIHTNPVIMIARC